MKYLVCLMPTLLLLAFILGATAGPRDHTPTNAAQRKELHGKLNALRTQLDTEESQVSAFAPRGLGR